MIRGQGRRARCQSISVKRRFVNDGTDAIERRHLDSMLDPHRTITRELIEIAAESLRLRPVNFDPSLGPAPFGRKIFASVIGQEVGLRSELHRALEVAIRSVHDLMQGSAVPAEGDFSRR